MKATEMEQYMRLALKEAQAAFNEEEIPVGAVVIRNGSVLSAAHNTSRQKQDLTAHAELTAMQEAARSNGGRLDGCILFVTLEPCAMCTGAAMNLRLPEIVYGAYDPVNGFCGSIADITDHWCEHSVRTTGGILEHECHSLLSKFFQNKR